MKLCASIAACCMIIICKWAQDLFYVWLTLQHQMQRCCSKSLQSRFHPTPKSCVLKRLVNLTGNASIPQITHPEKNAHMCDTGLRRCHCGAGFPEHRLVWSQGSTSHSHRWDLATVLRGGGSQPWHMQRCVTQTSGNAVVVQDSQNIA